MRRLIAKIVSGWTLPGCKERAGCFQDIGIPPFRVTASRSIRFHHGVTRICERPASKGKRSLPHLLHTALTDALRASDDRRRRLGSGGLGFPLLYLALTCRAGCAGAAASALHAAAGLAGGLGAEAPQGAAKGGD